jgi:diadenosine tetraphosphate (Ap4A) HIT family hydrolase
MSYDKGNVFYKLIHKELKSNIILEGKYFVAISDIAPKAPVHILVISKGEYTDYYDMLKQAQPEEVYEINKAVADIIDMMKLREGGFKIISNSGKFGAQEVYHMHIHIMGKPSDQV